MAINYDDPRFQQVLLRKGAMNPWGGSRGIAKETGQWAGEQTKTGLDFGRLGLMQKMNAARINQMQFEQGMGEKRVGLEGQYVGLGEKNLGIKSQMMDLAGKSQENNFAQNRWKYNAQIRNLADAESTLNLATWLGVGTSAYAGYEGYTRKKKLEEDAVEQKKWNEEMKEMMRNHNRQGGV